MVMVILPVFVLHSLKDGGAREVSEDKIISGMW